MRGAESETHLISLSMLFLFRAKLAKLERRRCKGVSPPYLTCCFASSRASPLLLFTIGWGCGWSQLKQGGGEEQGGKL